MPCRPTTLVVALALAVQALPADAADPESVYRVNPAVDGTVMGISAAAALIPYLLQDRIITERCPCDRSEVPAFERFVIGYRSDAADIASDAVATLAIAVPVGLDALALGWTRPLLEDGIVYAETLLVNGAIVTTVKDLVQRPTPRAYAGDPDIISKPTGYRSFYSGHTSNTVAALTAAAWTAHFRYGADAWPWVAVGVIGAGVAVLRIVGGNHFPTDVLVGAAVGFGIGTAVPWLHRRPTPENATAPARTGLSIGLPLLQRPGGARITLLPMRGGLAIAGAM